MIKAVIFDFNGVIYTDDYDRRLLDYIDQLRKNYKISMISNFSAAGYQRYVVPVKDYFNDIVISGHVGLFKPEPQIYQLASKRLGLKPDECIYVDDHDFRVDGAVKTGMHGIIYTNFGQFKPELEKKLTGADD